MPSNTSLHGTCVSWDFEFTIITATAKKLNLLCVGLGWLEIEWGIALQTPCRILGAFLLWYEVQSRRETACFRLTPECIIVLSRGSHIKSQLMGPSAPSKILVFRLVHFCSCDCVFENRFLMELTIRTLLCLEIPCLHPKGKGHCFFLACSERMT